MKLRKKIVIAGLGVVAAVGIGTAAFAFFTSNGSGDGNATVTTKNDPITFTVSDIPNLVPGVPVDVSVTAENPNGYDVTVGPLTIDETTAKALGNDGLPTDRCPIKVIPEDPKATHLIPKGDPKVVKNTLKVALRDDLDKNQNICLGGKITFTVAADALP